MNTHLSLRSLVVIFVLAVLASGILLPACTPSGQSAIETQMAKAAKTAAAEGSKFAATQFSNLKETTAVIAATEAFEIKQTLEAVIPTLDPNSVNLKVQAARILLKSMDVMKSPWNQVYDAPIQNTNNERSARNYADVIDQFEVDAAEFAGRYQAGGVDLEDTRCNIFAGDVMRAMGVPLPTKGNLGKGQGNPNAAYSDPMTAKAVLLNDYLNKRIAWVTSATDPGVLSDWEEVDPATQEGLLRLINYVTAGKPALVSDAGHIAVIRPDQVNIQSWQDLIIAQAGATNFLFGPIEGHFFGTPQFFIND